VIRADNARKIVTAKQREFFQRLQEFWIE